MNEVRVARTTMPHAVRLVDARGRTCWVNPTNPALTLSLVEGWGDGTATIIEGAGAGAPIWMAESPDEVAAMLWPEVRHGT